MTTRIRIRLTLLSSGLVWALGGPQGVTGGGDLWVVVATWLSVRLILGLKVKGYRDSDTCFCSSAHCKKMYYVIHLCFIYYILFTKHIQWWPKLLEHLIDLKILTFFLPPKHDFIS